MSTITFFHAHPDDEAIATGGTMARLAAEGHRVVLVTATRGELGEIPEGLLTSGQTLAERRADELARACQLLGVSRQVFLDYHDSGMEDDPNNAAPGCFAMADLEEAAGALAAILIEEASDVLVVYDEHGGYGHPDHVQVNRVGMRARTLAQVPGLYFATMNRDFFRDLAGRMKEAGIDAPGDDSEGLETMGEPASRLTTVVDVTAFLDTKREAMRAHASQISETSFFLALPDELFTTVWGQEWYIRIDPPWTGAPGAERETMLLTTGPGPDGAGLRSFDGAVPS